MAGASQVALSGNIEIPLDLEKKLCGDAFTVQLPRAPTEGSEASGSTYLLFCVVDYIRLCQLAGKQLVYLPKG